MRQYCLPFTLSFIVIIFHLLFFLSILYSQTPGSPASNPELQKLSECAYPALAEPEDLPDEGMICVVVRTSPEHLSRVNYSVRRLLKSLEQMEYKNWRAYFFFRNWSIYQQHYGYFCGKTFRHCQGKIPGSFPPSCSSPRSRPRIYSYGSRHYQMSGGYEMAISDQR